MPWDYPMIVALRAQPFLPSGVREWQPLINPANSFFRTAKGDVKFLMFPFGFSVNSSGIPSRATYLVTL
jgi:hypothetical protein